MDIVEAQTAIKALYLQAAALAGLSVGPHSPERLVVIVNQGYAKVTANRKPEAVANILTLIAQALMDAQEKKQKMLHETSIDDAQNKVCPIYPFGGAKQQSAPKKSRKKS